MNELARRNGGQARHDGASGPAARALPLRAAIGSMETLGALALAWLDFDSAPRVIVSGDLLILWANTAARAALAGRRDLENRLGSLAMVNVQNQEALAAFLAGAGAAVSSWCVERGDGDGHVVIHAQRVDWIDDGVLGVTFFGSGSDFTPRFANIDRVFGLTAAEHNVLADLLDGRTAEAIAARRAVSIETTRSHIRKIYGKLAVSSREMLFRKCQAFRI